MVGRAVSLSELLSKYAVASKLVMLSLWNRSRIAFTAFGRRVLSHAISFCDKLLALRTIGLPDGHLSSTGAYPSGALGKALWEKVVISASIGAGYKAVKTKDVNWCALNVMRILVRETCLR